MSLSLRRNKKNKQKMKLLAIVKSVKKRDYLQPVDNKLILQCKVDKFLELHKLSYDNVQVEYKQTKDRIFAKVYVIYPDFQTGTNLEQILS